MISFEYKFLFVDITKTAGTAICQVLENYGGKGKHHSINRALPGLPSNSTLIGPPSEHILDEYFCFTFVRNPYDRLISLYSYCQSAPIQEKFSKEGWRALSTASHRALPTKALNRDTYWPSDFSEFVEWLVEHESYYNDFTGEKYLCMKDWIVDNNGKVRVSFIGKYENLQNDFDCVLQKIGGEKLLLPRVRESMGRFKYAASKALQNSKALQSTIQSYYDEDFEYFKYSTLFEDSSFFRELVAKNV